MEQNDQYQTLGGLCSNTNKISLYPHQIESVTTQYTVDFIINSVVPNVVHLSTREIILFNYHDFSTSRLT